MTSGGFDDTDSDGTGAETDATTDRRTFTRRRTFLRASAPGAVAATTLLAGCPFDQTETRRYEAAPVRLAPEAAESGYRLEDASTAEANREEEAGGITLEVTLISQLASYDVPEGTTFVQTPEVGLASTPAAEEAGVNLNPITQRSMRELLTGNVGRPFLEQFDIDPDWQRGPERLDTGQGTLLDTDVEFTSFVGITGDGEFALLHLARVEDGDDEVLVGDSRTTDVDDTDRPFVGEQGYIDQATADESSEMFVDLLPLVVHGDPPGTPTGTDVPADDTIPVLDVTSRGLSQEKATALAAELGVDGEFVVDEHGALQYVDPAAYMPLPSADVDPRPEPGEGDREGQDASMALDVDGLAERPEPPDADRMEDEFLSALEATEPLPAAPVEVSTRTSHATVELVEKETDETTLERELDTAVYVDSTVDGIPIVGSGAHIRARFSTPDDGGDRVVSDVRHAFREVEHGDAVPRAPPEAASERYRELVSTVLNPDSIELDDPQLVYLAPDLNRANDNPVGPGQNRVQSLVPHYEIGGTASIQAGEQDGTQEVTLLRRFVPAVDDPAYVPDVSVEASAEGNEIDASVSIEGGQPPYRVEWGTTDAVVAADTGGDPRTLSDTLRSREAIDETTVTVEVTDANGVTVRDQRSLTVDVSPQTARRAASADESLGPRRSTTRPGRADVGLESSAYPPYGEGLVQQAKTAGIAEEFSWIDNMVWEKDWKPSTDNQYGADTADLVYEVAHGNPRGFSPGNSNHDDGWVGTLAGDGAWGDYDLEWHSLMSCNVLAPNDSQCGGCRNESRVERWGQEFDGLHQLHGFQTTGYAWKKFPPAFVNYFTGLGAYPPLPMRVAWFLAVDNHQPGTKDDQRWDKRGVVMAPIDDQGRTPINDWFWGRGPVGPDIPNHDIDRFCTLVAAEGGN